ncbi:MAG: tryptophan-rich sensory protein [Eubacteriales bacterium]
MKCKHNLINRIRSELHFINWKLVLLSAVVMLFLGMLTGIFGGSSYLYHCLIRPGIAPSVAAFIIIWSILYLLLGACVGLILGLVKCMGNNCVRRSLFWLALVVLSNLLWYPIFFGLEAFVIAFLVLVLHLFLTLVAMGKLFRTSFLVFMILLLYSIWMFFCMFLNFSIIILN